MKKALFKSDSKSLESICRDYFHLMELSSNKTRGHRLAIDKFHALDQKCKTFASLAVMDNEEMDVLHYFFLRPFDGLRELHLYMCPPSLVVDIFDFRDKIEVLEMIQCGIPDLSSVLAPIEVSYLSSFPSKASTIANTQVVPSSYQWSKLRQLRLSNCGLASLDATFHLMPEVEIIDISNNSIGRLIHLQDCVNLRRLNISHNCIRRLNSIDRVLGNVKILDLSYNQVEILSGIDKLYALVSLNLAYNYVDDYREIISISRLPCLEHVHLIGNPISDLPEYRVLTFQHFLMDGTVMQSGRDVPTLDGYAMTKSEVDLLRSVMFRAIQDQQRFTSYTFRRGNSFDNRENDSHAEISIGGMDYIIDLVKAEYGDLYAPTNDINNGDAIDSSLRPTQSRDEPSRSRTNNLRHTEPLPHRLPVDGEDQDTGFVANIRALRDEWWGILSGQAYAEQKEIHQTSLGRSMSMSETIDSRNSFSQLNYLEANPQRQSSVSDPRRDHGELNGAQSPNFTSPGSRLSFSSQISAPIDFNIPLRQTHPGSIVVETHKQLLSSNLQTSSFWKTRLWDKRRLLDKVSDDTTVDNKTPQNASLLVKKRGHVELNELLCERRYHVFPDLEIVKQGIIDKRQELERSRLASQQAAHQHQKSVDMQQLATLHGGEANRKENRKATRLSSLAFLEQPRVALSTTEVAEDEFGRFGSVSMTHSKLSYLEAAIGKIENSESQQNPPDRIDANPDSITENSGLEIKLGDTSAAPQGASVLLPFADSSTLSTLAKYELEKKQRQERLLRISAQVEGLEIKIHEKEKEKEEKTKTKAHKDLKGINNSRRPSDGSGQAVIPMQPFQADTSAVVKSLTFNPDISTFEDANIPEQLSNITSEYALNNRVDRFRSNSDSQYASSDDQGGNDNEDFVLDEEFATPHDPRTDLNFVLDASTVLDQQPFTENNDQVGSSIDHVDLMVRKDDACPSIIEDSLSFEVPEAPSIATQVPSDAANVLLDQASSPSSIKTPGSEVDLLLSLFGPTPIEGGPSRRRSGTAEANDSRYLPIDRRMGREISDDTEDGGLNQSDVNRRRLDSELSEEADVLRTTVSRANSDLGLATNNMSRQHKEEKRRGGRYDAIADVEKWRLIHMAPVTDNENDEVNNDPESDKPIAEVHESEISKPDHFTDVARGIDGQEGGIGNIMITSSLPEVASAPLSYPQFPNVSASELIDKVSDWATPRTSEISLMVPTGVTKYEQEYIGNPVYRNLSVVDNLELYFKEQVFNSRRSSGQSAFLIQGPPLEAVLALDQSKSSFGAGSTAFGGESEKGHIWELAANSASKFVPAPPVDEQLELLYSVNMIVLNSCQSERQSDFGTFGEDGKGGRSASAGDSKLPSPQRESKARFGRLKKLNASNGTGTTASDNNSPLPVELPMLLVVTNVTIYIVYLGSLPTTATFLDAPVPMMFRAHPVHHLKDITIFFGFQRCLLQFARDADEDIHMQNDSFSKCALYPKYSQSLPLGCNTFSYQILTRDKTKTNPIVTQIPQVANDAKMLFISKPKQINSVSRSPDRLVLQDDVSNHTVSAVSVETQARVDNHAENCDLLHSMDAQTASHHNLPDSVGNSPIPIRRSNARVGDIVGGLVTPSEDERESLKSIQELPQPTFLWSNPTINSNPGAVAEPSPVGPVPPRVRIVNKNADLIKAVHLLVREKADEDAEPDVLLYQMLWCYQASSSKSAGAGALLARTLVFTPCIVFLCEEDLSSPEVKITVVDFATPREISSLKTEPGEDPLSLTVQIKALGSMFSSRRRVWKLLLDSKPMHQKIVVEWKKLTSKAN